ncbi:MAG: DUF1934 domain-containing protein [Clostridiales bacterium]|uniref:DUF1934 domain-containing protein n=1 Tax=Clostridium sp. N3C TaxID=1776758 RepID=UPI00092E1B7F|nr:DUF1934 domain-containing protein [Clostridium sp. N3C]NLZ47714.1 DUF1934 domain-containing protein [Clostridiales bacterium]SCN23863.1 putative beta-barrel protein YwiB [Clostridium sp. N3C]
MGKKALISITSHHKASENDIIEVQTPGEYFKKDNKYYAEYEETKISGMEGTTTILEINPEKVVLMREGTTTAKMEFEKNNKYTTLYNTPYGVLELVISTRNIKVDIDDNGGDIYIDYDMSVAGQASYNTELNINIKA